MPFRLNNSWTKYQRMMNAIFHNMINRFIKVHIDDILVKSKKASYHVEHLRRSFYRMKNHALNLNPSKYSFGVKAENS